MADLITVQTFIGNADENAEFIQRAEVALYEDALALREGMGATLSAQEIAEQEYALSVIANPRREAQRMLPALAIKANNAGLISDGGVITATDTQIRDTVGALITEFSQYIAPAT